MGVITATNDRGAPYTVAIVAMGPSRNEYLQEAVDKSGRFKVADETWTINALAGIIQHDRAFIMDSLPYFRKASREHKHLEGYNDWLHKHPGPIYTSNADSNEFPGAVEYPLEEVLNTIKFPYLRNTVAYAIAFAIHIGVKEMRLYGMDFTYSENKGVAEAGRANVEYLVSMAISMGIKVWIAGSSTLCDQSLGRPLYGYSAAPKVSKVDGRFKVEY